MASGNYFSVLKTRAALGRTFDHADDQPPLGTATVVLSDAYWSRRFNRDPAVIGRTIELNTRAFTILGVLPREFKGARSPSGNPHVPDVWVPLWCQPLLEPGDARLRHRTTWWGLQAIGRLRAGVSLQEARTRIATVAAALDSDYPGQRRPRAPWVSRLTDIDPRLLQTEGAAVVGVLSTRLSLRDADRLRQRRRPAPGAGLLTTEGNRGPALARRGSRANRPSVRRRGSGAFGDRHSARLHRRVLDSERGRLVRRHAAAHVVVPARRPGHHLRGVSCGCRDDQHGADAGAASVEDRAAPRIDTVGRGSHRPAANPADRHRGRGLGGVAPRDGIAHPWGDSSPFDEPRDAGGSPAGD